MPTEPGQSPGRKIFRTKLDIAAAALSALLVILVGGFLIWTIFLTGFINRLADARPPEHSARYYPRDTVLYAWATLLPPGGQREHAGEIWDRFQEIPEFLEIREEFEETIRDELGVEIDDLREWIGTDLSAGILGYDVQRDDTRWAATAGVRKRGAALAFLETLTARLEEQRGARYTRGSQEGFTTITSPEGKTSFAVSDDVMMFASARYDLDRMIRNAGLDSSETLEGEQHFQDARATMSEGRAASAYLNPVEFLRMVESEDPASDLLLAREHLEEKGPAWAALHGSLERRAAVAEITVPDAPNPALQAPPLNSVHRLLPRETTLFVSMSFDPNVDHWREAMEGYGVPDISGQTNLDELELLMETPPGEHRHETAADLLDLLLELIRENTGIDPETGFLDHLAGEITVASWTQDAQDGNPIAAGEETSVMVMLSHQEEGQEALEATMISIEELAQGFTGETFGTVDLEGGGTARVAGAGTDHNPGYMFHRGHLVIAASREALETVAALRIGQENGLSDLPEFRRVNGLLGERRQFMAYLDVGRAADWDVISHLADRKTLRVVGRSAGALALSAHTPREGEGDGISRYRMALTLFPE